MAAGSWVAIILLVIGIIMLIIGIALFATGGTDSTNTPVTGNQVVNANGTVISSNGTLLGANAADNGIGFGVWFLIIGGILLIIIAIIIWAFSAYSSRTTETITGPPPGYVIDHQHVHTRNGHINYVRAQPPAQHIIYQQAAPQLPPPVTTTVRQVGSATFDPDPTKTQYVKQPPPVHTTRVGPYGPGGSTVAAPGVYQPPAQLVEQTVDLPPQPVPPGYVLAPGFGV